ncbi:MAG: hypothetical protein ACM34L_16795, partial [Gemmatimonas sp.]
MGSQAQLRELIVLHAMTQIDRRARPQPGMKQGRPLKAAPYSMPGTRFDRGYGCATPQFRPVTLA